jgi:hypothetical protein
MLRQNGNRDSLGCTRFFGAGTLGNGSFPNINMANSHNSGSRCNLFMGEADMSYTASIPDGTRHPVAWLMPQKAGGLRTFNNLNGTGTISASILSVKLLEAAIDGDGGLTAFGSLLVQAVANITGSGGVSAADLRAFLAMVAAIGGSGNAAGTATGLAELLATLTGSGTLDDSVISGIAELIADLVVTGTGLTTANVASAVWGAAAASNNVTGTMGEKVNDAGSASNPWTEVIESGYTAEQILRMMAAVLMGEVSGAGTGTETFKGIDGTTDRVIVEATEEGNRTSVTLDGA